MAEVGPEKHRALVAAESERYLAKQAEVQTWDGTEPALQVLWLPLVTDEPLPQYSKKP